MERWEWRSFFLLLGMGRDPLLLGAWIFLWIPGKVVVAPDPWNVRGQVGWGLEQLGIMGSSWGSLAT